LEVYKSFVAIYSQSKAIDEAYYRMGLSYQNLERLEEAMRTYDKVRLEYAWSTFADDAQAGIADLYFEHGDYNSALIEYAKILKNFPHSDKVGFAEYMVGLSFKEMGNEEQAKIIWERIPTKHPDERDLISEPIKQLQALDRK